MITLYSTIALLFVLVALLFGILLHYRTKNLISRKRSRQRQDFHYIIYYNTVTNNYCSWCAVSVLSTCMQYYDNNMSSINNHPKLTNCRGLACRRRPLLEYLSRAIRSTERYSTRDTFIDEDEDVKPPAVPPKTYLGEEDEKSMSQCPSDEDISRPNYDNCSLDSDDIKIEMMENLEDTSTTGETVQYIQAYTRNAASFILL